MNGSVAHRHSGYPCRIGDYDPVFFHFHAANSLDLRHKFQWGLSDIEISASLQSCLPGLIQLMVKYLKITR